MVAAQDTNFKDIEMPGLYASGDEVLPEGAVLIESIASDVAIIRRHGLSFRRLAFHGTDGRTRHFVVQSGQQWTSGEGQDCAEVRKARLAGERRADAECYWHGR